MITEIAATVRKYSSLRLQVNKGERHRIIKQGVSRGSLWLEKQTECYRLQLTGEVSPLLADYVMAQVGEPAYVDKGYNVWRLPFNGTMEKIVRRLAEADALT